MRKKLQDVAPNIVRELLHYDPDTGVFTWIATGEVAGGVHGKYHRISIGGVQYHSHVLAWVYMKGTWPCGEVDHWDRNRLNNRWKNLREVDHAGNQWNKTVQKRNKTGFKHVGRHGSSWRYQIITNGVKVAKSGFKTPEEAYEASLEVIRQIRGEEFVIDAG